jgi:Pentapeptide repeats (8 copies)
VTHDRERHDPFPAGAHTRRTPAPKPGWRTAQLTRKDRILRSTGLHDKTLWDWLQLLIVPTVVALLAGLFTTVQIVYQQAAEERLQQRITDQNAEIQRFIEEQRTQSASIGAYLDLMTQLLLERDLAAAKENSLVRAIAQAQTTRVLRDADPSSKQTVLLFLYDSGLISKGAPIVDLSNADLSDANLRLTDLSGASLSGADLSGADLFDANLFGADLSDANLRNANLSDANLSDANLSDANLGGAELDRANLREAGLSGADLSGADLSAATGLTNEELEEQAKSLKDAIMPDGSKHP